MGLDNPLHIAFLVVLLLLVFGARRLPEIGRSLGSGMREFKQSINGEASHQQPPSTPPTLTSGSQEPPPQPVPTTARTPTQDPFSQRDEHSAGQG